MDWFLYDNGLLHERVKTISSNLCGNCSFSQSFLTRKLGENAVFYVVATRFVTVAYVSGKFRIEKGVQSEHEETLKKVCL